MRLAGIRKERVPRPRSTPGYAPSGCVWPIPGRSTHSPDAVERSTHPSGASISRLASALISSQCWRTSSRTRTALAGERPRSSWPMPVSRCSFRRSKAAPARGSCCRPAVGWGSPLAAVESRARLGQEQTVEGGSDKPRPRGLGVTAGDSRLRRGRHEHNRARSANASLIAETSVPLHTHQR